MFLLKAADGNKNSQQTCKAKIPPIVSFTSTYYYNLCINLQRDIRYEYQTRERQADITNLELFIFTQTLNRVIFKLKYVLGSASSKCHLGINELRLLSASHMRQLSRELFSLKAYRERVTEMQREKNIDPDSLMGWVKTYQSWSTNIYHQALSVWEAYISSSMYICICIYIYIWICTHVQYTIQILGGW